MLSRWIALFTIGFFFILTPISGEESERLSTEQRRHLSALQSELRASSAQALSLIEQMIALGPAADSATRQSLLNVLRDDARAIPAIIRQAGDLDALPAFLDEFASLREQALANIAVLAKDDSLKKAKEFHGQLLSRQQKLSQLLDMYAAVAQMISRRQTLKDLYDARATDFDQRFRPAAEETLQQHALDFLGIDLAAFETVKTATQQPTDPWLAHLWTHMRNQRIQSWNESQKNLMSIGEWDNLVAVNSYRQALGLRPYEVDHRLLQAARQHSKEMADKGYFSHSSPTKGQESHTRRMANAGYRSGYSENIANGARSGDMAFWMWFNSPPHHKNMVNAQCTQMGVGQWGELWTQVFGKGKPLDRLDPEQRLAETTPRGDILAPR